MNSPELTEYYLQCYSFYSIYCTFYRRNTKVFDYGGCPKPSSGCYLISNICTFSALKHSKFPTHIWPLRTQIGYPGSVFAFLYQDGYDRRWDLSWRLRSLPVWLLGRKAACPRTSWSRGRSEPYWMRAQTGLTMRQGSSHSSSLSGTVILPVISL
jgi:hypothetical protein